jgi:phosphate starvation-inducible PhoH-like protein
MHWLVDPSTPVVFLLGPAGCGKTALAIAAALIGMGERMYNKITLARVDVAAGESIGFLPGSASDKNEVWVAPMISECKHWVGDEATQGLIKAKTIENMHVQLLRGHTFR